VILIADWKPQDGLPVNIVAAYDDTCPQQEASYPYCMLKSGEDFIIGTKYGNMYAVSKHELIVFKSRKVDDPS
jgi:hypothetical protein